MKANVKKEKNLIQQLTKLHWLTAQIAGEQDVASMYRLIINGFSHIIQSAQCSLLIPAATEEGLKELIAYGSQKNSRYCSKLMEIYRNAQSEKFWKVNLNLPCKASCLSPCNFSLLKGISLYERSGNLLGLLVAYFPVEYVPDEEADSTQEQLVMEIYATQVALSLENAKLADQFRNMAFTDVLTGLYNHRHFQEVLHKEISRASRTNSELSLALIDVDKFKSYNDTYGHPAGDVVLRMVATILKKNVRDMDTVARYGGEEFVVIMPECGRKGSEIIGQRLVEAVASTEFPHREVTISLGVATYPYDAKMPADLIEKADQALYAAKEAGRNRMKIYSRLALEKEGNIDED